MPNLKVHVFSIVSCLILSIFSTPATAQFEALPTSKISSGDPIAWEPVCGTPVVDAVTAASVRERLRLSEEKVFADGEMKVPVAVHLITSGKNGKFSRSVVDLMINNMNAACSGTGFSFYLVKLDYTDNRKWYESCGIQQANESAMKKRLAYYPA